MEQLFNSRLANKIREISDMSVQSMDLLRANMEVQELYKGQVLLREGQVCRNIYFIESGQLRTFFVKDGKEININFSFEDSFITNLKSFLTGEPSWFYIQASETTVAWKLNKEQLLSLYRQSCEIESFVRKLLEKMLVKQEDHSNLFKIYNSAERYEYVAKYYPQLLQRVSLSQLASYLGISRETISRIRKGNRSLVDV